MITNPSELENLIRDKLIESLPSVVVSAMPDDPREWGNPVSRAELNIGFKGRKCQPPKGNLQNRDYFNQQATLEFEIVLRNRNLRSHKSTYEIIDVIINALIGVGGGLSDGFYLISDGFSATREGIWFYGLLFGIDVILRRQNGS